MKYLAALLPVLVLAGCQSGPRPYDGNLGFKVDRSAGNVVVTYIEERRVPVELHLQRIAQVCTDNAPGSMPAVMSQQETEIAVTGLAAVATGPQVTGGSTATHAQQASVAPVQISDQLQHRLKARTIVAACR